MQQPARIDGVLKTTLGSSCVYRLYRVPEECAHGLTGDPNAGHFAEEMGAWNEVATIAYISVLCERRLTERVFLRCTYVMVEKSKGPLP